MVARIVQAAMVVLGIALLGVLLLWLYRFVQYRQQVNLSHARWLHYESDQKQYHHHHGYAEDALVMNWPPIAPLLLSPIPEERGGIESGRVRVFCVWWHFVLVD